MPRASSPDEDPTRRERILRSAEEVFAEVGFGAARVDEIARRAGCNKGLIYYYFSGKEQLYDAVVASVIEKRSPSLEAVRDGGFDAWLGALSAVTTGADNRAWVRLLAMEGLDDDRSRALVHESERLQAWRESVQLLVRAQAHGEITPDLDSEMLVLLFVTNVLGSQVLPQFTRMVTGMSPDTQAFADRLQRFHLQLVKHLAPPAK